MRTLISRSNGLAHRPADETGVTEHSVELRQSDRFALTPEMKETWRKVYTPLILAQPQTDQPRVLGITSAHHGEGKTTVALGLALTIAEDLQDAIALVDLNLFKPRLSGLLDFGDATGIANYLASSLSFEHIAKQWNSTNLWVIPAGASEASPSRLLRSKRAPDLLRSAFARYSVVVLDLPSALSYSDTQLIVPLLDSLAIVARVGISTTESIRKVLQTTDRVTKRGIVINDFRSSVPDRLQHWVLGCQAQKAYGS